MEKPINLLDPAEDRNDSRESTPTPKSDSPQYNYELPSKSVKSMLDMGPWQKSQAYYDLIGFINGISVAIQGKRLSHDCEVSSTMHDLIKMIGKFSALIDETPPVNQPQRFGNQAYREWSRKMLENAPIYLRDAIPEKFHEAVPEIVVYLTESFGNSTRIDYGTGHELSFVMFLCCLFKIEALVESDSVACGLKLFNSYLLLARKLQLTYRMEPAGSHGVWSLDDYQFVPFIWGSAQLAVNSPFDPQKFLDEVVINEFKDEYIFIGCIDYICQVKTGHFAEHSNQLWSISAVQSWAKINTGLVKMFQKEILSKFPVIQHVLFGSLMSFKPAKPGQMIGNAKLGMLPPSAAPPPRNLASGDSSKLT